MSLDKPIYQRIRERSRWLGGLWLVSDLGYYLGLVWAAISFAMDVAIPAVGILAGFLGDGDQFEKYWPLLPIFLVGLPIGIAVVLTAAFFQRLAYRRSGIENEDRKEPGGANL